MIRRAFARSSYWLALGALLVAVALAAGFVFVRVLPDLRDAGLFGAVVSPGASGVPTAPGSPGASAGPSGSPTMDMNGAVIPADSDCSGCHKTAQGAIGLRPIPAMGHPLEGWSQCTNCHSTATLVATAPGHSGIHATECTICHKPGDLPAPLSRPHRDRQNQACLSCHGTAKAPLPADMSHRSESVCWLCHRLADVPPPIPAHRTLTGETDCLTCHVAGKVGALPPDHVSRTTAQCLLCHDVPLNGGSSASPATSSGAGASSGVPASAAPAASLPWPSASPTASP